MTAEDKIKDIQSALQRRFRAAGHGSIRRVQETLKLGSGYFKDQRRRGRRRVDLRVLFRTLEELSVEPADFFADALGTADMLAVFRSEAGLLRRRLRKLPRLLELEAELATSGPEDPLDTAPDAALAELDTEASEEPKRAVRRAHYLLRRLPEFEVPRLLGIAASAYSRLGELNVAHLLLARAFELTEERFDPSLRADLLRRTSKLAMRQNGGERALALSEMAALEYARSGNLVSLGAVMTDQGGFQFKLGRHRKALRSFSSALAYLSADSDCSQVLDRRFVALLNSGKCHQRLGELDKARRCAGEAGEIADRVTPSFRAELAWLRSSIALQCSDWPEAENSLLELLELDPPITPLDRARASVELVRAQLFAARNLEAYETAKQLTLLVQPLKRNRAASAALMELLRIALAGRGMTPDIVEGVARALNEVRRRAPVAG